MAGKLLVSAFEFRLSTSGPGVGNLKACLEMIPSSAGALDARGYAVNLLQSLTN